MGGFSLAVVTQLLVCELPLYANDGSQTNSLRYNGIATDLVYLTINPRPFTNIKGYRSWKFPLLSDNF